MRHRMKSNHFLYNQGLDSEEKMGTQTHTRATMASAAWLTQDDSLGTAVVTRRQGSEALLSCSVLQNTTSSALLDTLAGTTCGSNRRKTRADRHKQQH